MFAGCLDNSFYGPPLSYESPGAFFVRSKIIYLLDFVLMGFILLLSADPIFPCWCTVHCDRVQVFPISFQLIHVLLCPWLDGYNTLLNVITRTLSIFCYFCV